MDYKHQIQAILHYLKNDDKLKKFEFYNEFFDKWKKLLKYHSKKRVAFLPKGTNDYDQTFNYIYKLENTDLNFYFSINVIRSFFELCRKDENVFPPIILEYNDDELTFGNSKCNFNFYSIDDCKREYGDIEDVLVIQQPTVPTTFIVIDGNHRVSSQIHSGAKRIKARFCYPDYCYKSLAEPFSVAVLVFLFDCAFIYHNLHRIPDWQIKMQLSIFNSASFVNNLDKRKKLDFKI